MVDERCRSVSVEDLTLAIDHEIDQKGLLNSPSSKPKRKLSDVSLFYVLQFWQVVCCPEC